MAQELRDVRYKNLTEPFRKLAKLQAQAMQCRPTDSVTRSAGLMVGSVKQSAEPGAIIVRETAWMTGLVSKWIGHLAYLASYANSSYKSANLSCKPAN